MRGTAQGSLSDGQIDCLALVAQNLTSKEIAIQLGISRHTVDKRVRKAIRQLGARDRRQAARFIQDENRWARRRRRTERAQFIAGEMTAERPAPKPEGLPLPFATAARPANTMRAAERIGWIAAIAAAAGISTIVYLAGMESLGRLLGH
jgi:DNA-binding CsgD family transcriptional regulator